MQKFWLIFTCAFIVAATPVIAGDNKCANLYKACGAECQKINDDTPDQTKLGCQSRCSASYATCDVSSLLPGGSSLVNWLTTKSPKKAVVSQCRQNFKACSSACDNGIDEGSTKLNCRSSCSATYAACDFTDMLPGKGTFSWLVKPSTAPTDNRPCVEIFKSCGAECMKIPAGNIVSGESNRLGCQSHCSASYASCDVKKLLPGREVFPWMGTKIDSVGNFLKDIARSKKQK